MKKIRSFIRTFRHFVSNITNGFGIKKSWVGAKIHVTLQNSLEETLLNTKPVAVVNEETIEKVKNLVVDVIYSLCEKEGIPLSEEHRTDAFIDDEDKRLVNVVFTAKLDLEVSDD